MKRRMGMKQRVMTATLIILFLIPFFYSKLVYGHNLPLILLAIVLAIIALTELIAAKENQSRIHAIVRLTMYVAMLYLAFNEVVMETVYHRDPLSFDVIPLLVIIVGLWMVIDRHFRIDEAGFALFGTFYIGLSFLGLSYFLIKRTELLFYILLITILTDTFAYFVGRTIGKRKLIPEVSPNKTVEGSLGGTFVGSLGGALYLYFATENENWLLLIGLSLGLSVVAQFGDLVASKIKRTVGIKDYGNLFPGHGGVLDRLDSLLFTALTLYYVLQLVPNLI